MRPRWQVTLEKVLLLLLVRVRAPAEWGARASAVPAALWPPEHPAAGLSSVPELCGCEVGVRASGGDGGGWRGPTRVSFSVPGGRQTFVPPVAAPHRGCRVLSARGSAGKGLALKCLHFAPACRLLPGQREPGGHRGSLGVAGCARVSAATPAPPSHQEGGLWEKQQCCCSLGTPVQHRGCSGEVCGVLAAPGGLGMPLHGQRGSWEAGVPLGVPARCQRCRVPPRAPAHPSGLVPTGQSEPRGWLWAAQARCP